MTGKHDPPGELDERAGSSLRADQLTLKAAASDFGKTISRKPDHVTTPLTPGDVVEIVHYARRSKRHIKVQGTRHSTYGQGQLTNAIIVNTNLLASTNVVDPANQSVTLDAGAQWRSVVERTTPYGLIPPVLTDFLGLSVGGTLAVGGFGSQSFRFGTQADNIEELTVVTGTGELVICSKNVHSDLFNAVLGGMGSFGVIVKVKLNLVPAPPMIRLYKVLYTDLEPFLADQHRAAKSRQFEAIEGSAIPNSREELLPRFGDAPALSNLGSGSPKWLYQLKLAKGFGPDNEPDDNLIFNGLSSLSGVQAAKTLTALQYATRMDAEVEIMQARGLWQLPHQFFSVLLPTKTADTTIARALSSTHHEDMHHGPILINMMDRDLVKTPTVRMPGNAGTSTILFSALRNIYPATHLRAEQLLAVNRELYDNFKSLGGVLYPISAIPMALSDWHQHWGDGISQLQDAKRKYDPENIFPSPCGISHS